MTVAGEGANGVEAVRLNHALRPHIIAMDMTMPVMGGLEAAGIIMQEYPTRIVMLTDDAEANDTTLIAAVREVGALDVCQKPGNSMHDETARKFIKLLRAMSQVGVVRRRRTLQDGDAITLETITDYPGVFRRPEIVLIVSSTGGPPALETILGNLPAEFPLPVVIVQHISDEFQGNMIAWLDSVTALNLKVAEHHERPTIGNIYVAPAGKHLRITYNGRFSLEPDTENLRHIPSGDILLDSAAAAYGSNAIGIVLTGMGMDGAKGLSKMRAHGARTIVQDEATSIVFGMPKAAIELGGSEYVMPLDQIAGLLMQFATEKVDE
jgi:two-component system chemotaxis response regulator CheB